LENLLLNPTLSDLVGGIESVTLSDEEARRRGTQKTVLERRSPPTFDVLIEIQNRDRLAIHEDVAAAVDALLRGYPLPAEIRERIDGDIRIEKAKKELMPDGSRQQGYRRQNDINQATQIDQEFYSTARDMAFKGVDQKKMALKTMRIYPYGVARNRLGQAAKRLGVPAIIVNEPAEADVLVTLRSYYRKRQRTIMDAERRNVPIYVLRSNTVNQMQQFLSDLFNLYTTDISSGGVDTALRETKAAIDVVMNGERWVELRPAPSSIRRLQHQLAREAELVSHSYGKEPNRRVRIFRDT
jgi:hypothetical protein